MNAGMPSAARAAVTEREPTYLESVRGDLVGLGERMERLQERLDTMATRVTGGEPSLVNNNLNKLDDPRLAPPENIGESVRSAMRRLEAVAFELEHTAERLERIA